MQYTDLKEKRVLVTGASGGLGAAIAKAFADQGAYVIVHYNTRAEGAKQTLAYVQERTQGVSIKADLRDEEALENCFTEVCGVWDGLDILVNNAGIVLKSAILDADSRYWDDTLNINLRAPYLLSRLMAKHLVDTGRSGSIINNSSIHGHHSVENFSAYAASKAALEALTKVSAVEWAEHGIRVNAVAPGVVPVERTEVVLSKMQDTWMPHLPLGRYGQPDEIAKLTLFLASDEASGWTTGQSYIADGGMTARMDMPRRPKPNPPTYLD